MGQVTVETILFLQHFFCGLNFCSLSLTNLGSQDKLQGNKQFHVEVLFIIATIWYTAVLTVRSTAC